MKTHALHYYHTNIPSLNKEIEKTCEEIFHNNQTLTSNIEECEIDGKLYFLFFHNWLMKPIIDSYEAKEKMALYNELNNVV